MVLANGNHMELTKHTKTTLNYDNQNTWIVLKLWYIYRQQYWTSLKIYIWCRKYMFDVENNEHRQKKSKLFRHTDLWYSKNKWLLKETLCWLSKVKCTTLNREQVLTVNYCCVWFALFSGYHHNKCNVALVISLRSSSIYSLLCSVRW